MQLNQVTTKHFPLVRPRILPERFALARETARGIDFVPGTPRPARELPHLCQRKRMLATIARQVGHAGRGLPGIGAADPKPIPKLSERSRVVVVPLFLIEKWIEVGICIERDAEE